jgi:hypothetical protein
VSSVIPATRRSKRSTPGRVDGYDPPGQWGQAHKPAMPVFRARPPFEHTWGRPFGSPAAQAFQGRSLRTPELPQRRFRLAWRRRMITGNCLLILSGWLQVSEGDPIRSHDAFLDLLTGEVIPAFTTDVERGGEAGPNPAAEPDRWLFVPSLGSRAARQDMAEFAAVITYRPLRKRMEIAIEGMGAFRRFRDLIYSEGLVADWHAFSDSRRLARAREFLADLGVRGVRFLRVRTHVSRSTSGGEGWWSIP